MRTRSRLLFSFLAVHLVLALSMGWVAWSWLDASMRAQAQDSARSLGQVIAQGGFPLTEEVIAKLRALTGYQFRVLAKRAPLRAGTVQIEVESRVVEVDYQTDNYLRASRAVFVGTLVLLLGGSAGFGLVALWLAGQFARPVERLVSSARIIGSGDFDRAVTAVGSGEIRELAAELEHMRGRLRDLDRQHRQAERLAAIGTFTATIAHEVRNPLSAVRLTVQMLARRAGAESTDPGAAGFTLIMEELERLDLIVDELLAFSKGMTVRIEPCSLRAVAENVVRLLRRQAEHAAVGMVIVGDAQVAADPARLRQLLMNLLLNAIQALHASATRESGGIVHITIATDGFAVSDDGPGIAADVLPHLFEAFSSSRPSGTGLGLHLARAIAEAHGGTLTHQQQPIGACFVLGGLKPAP